MGAMEVNFVHLPPSPICLEQLLSNHHAQWLSVAPGSLAILSFFLHFRLITEVTQKVFRGCHARTWDLYWDLYIKDKPWPILCTLW